MVLLGRGAAGTVSPATTNRASRAKKLTPMHRKPLPSIMIGSSRRDRCGLGLHDSPKIFSRYVTAKQEILLGKIKKIVV